VEIIARRDRVGRGIGDALADQHVGDGEVVVPVVAGGERGVDAEAVEVEGVALGHRLHEALMLGTVEEADGPRAWVMLAGVL
jgi:hypothetical protein